MRLMDKMRDGIRHFLRIQDAPKQTFNIRELLNYDGNCVKNLIWYRGDSYELTQFYQNIPGGSDGVKFLGCTFNCWKRDKKNTYRLTRDYC